MMFYCFFANNDSLVKADKIVQAVDMFSPGQGLHLMGNISKEIVQLNT